MSIFYRSDTTGGPGVQRWIRQVHPCSMEIVVYSDGQTLSGGLNSNDLVTVVTAV